MKKTIYFVLGVIVGMVACFVILYLSGSIFEYFGIRFYESESDQQRNFNIFLVASTVCSLISGYLFAKKFA